MDGPRKKRRYFALGVLVTAALVAVLGLFLGIGATSSPSVVRGGQASTVTVVADTPDVDVDLRWIVRPTGDVYVSLLAEAPSMDEFNVYLVLTCDARLT